MSLQTNLILQAVLIGLQAINLTEVPESFRWIAVILLVALQAGLGAYVHFFNTNGSPQAVGYDPKAENKPLVPPEPKP